MTGRYLHWPQGMEPLNSWTMLWRSTGFIRKVAGRLCRQLLVYAKARECWKPSTKSSTSSTRARYDGRSPNHISRWPSRPDTTATGWKRQKTLLTAFGAVDGSHANGGPWEGSPPTPCWARPIRCSPWRGSLTKLNMYYNDFHA